MNEKAQPAQCKEPHTLTLGLVLPATQYKNPRGGIIRKDEGPCRPTAFLAIKKTAVKRQDEGCAKT